MIIEIDVPDDKDLMPYFTDKALTSKYIQCFASFNRDEDEINPTERARLFITGHLDKIFIKWQKRQAANSATIQSGGIS